MQRKKYTEEQISRYSKKERPILRLLISAASMA
jgi:hypothetical protein